MGKIILHVEGKSLPKMDLLSKSDPYLCVFIGEKKFILLAADYLQSIIESFTKSTTLRYVHIYSSKVFISPYGRKGEVDLIYLGKSLEWSIKREVPKS